MVENGEVVVSVGDRLFGPIQKDQLAYLLIAGDIIASDYVYLKAQARWVMVCELEIFSSLVPESEPPPFEEPSYYLFDRSGQLGPFTKSYVISKIKKGFVTPYDYILRKEEGRWHRLGDLDTFVKLFPQPPSQTPSEASIENLNALRGRGFQVRNSQVNSASEKSAALESSIGEIDLFQDASADSIDNQVENLESQGSEQKQDENAALTQPIQEEIEDSSKSEGLQSEPSSEGGAEEEKERNAHLDLSGLVNDQENEDEAQNTESFDVPSEIAAAETNIDSEFSDEFAAFLKQDPSEDQDSDQESDQDSEQDEISELEIPTLSGVADLEEKTDESKDENPKESEGSQKKTTDKDSHTDSIHLEDGQTDEYLTIVKD